MSSEGDCNAFFASSPVTNFPPPPGGIITVDSTCRIVDAAHILAKHNILCAPVRNVGIAEDAPWNEKYAGIVDMVASIDFFSLYEPYPQFLLESIF